jgi:thiol-disulfide isomerase/thioredoxin
MTPTGSSSVDRLGLTTFPVGSRPVIPAMSGRTLQGQTFSSTQFLGDVVVVNVWASWCEPCREESGTLAKMSQTLANQHVHFIGLDEADTRSAAIKFSASVGASYIQIFDQDSSVLARLKILPVKAIPSTMVLDAEGRVAGRVIGGVSAAELSSLVVQAASA